MKSRKEMLEKLAQDDTHYRVLENLNNEGLYLLGKNLFKW